MGNSSLRIRPTRAVLAGLVLAALPMVSPAFVSVGVSITVAPPALPVYVQPACPGIGYIWTPGYWAWDEGDYYWVPGTWVLAPSPGLLWTPGYWGWGGGLYVWHPGYWGPHVGFYGGINYGYGYTGVGFAGGYWHGGAFYYNRAVSNLGGLHVTNVYNRTVVNNITINRVSFNGGEGGVHARPNPRELAAEHDRHVDFTPTQREHEHMAFGNHDLRASVNGGKPRIAATERPAVFTGRGVIGARAAGAPYHAGEHGPAGAERAASGRGPDSRGAAVAAHGAVGHTMERNDRPAGATGSGNATVHPGAGVGMHNTGSSAAAHNIEPRGVGAHDAGARGGAVHNVPMAEHNTPMRSDRPPAASGNAGTHPSSGPDHSAEMHTGSGGLRGGNGDPRVARNDRPPTAMGAGGPAPHVNQPMQMRAEHSAPQGGHPNFSGSSVPHQFNGGAQNAQRPQMQTEASRPQVHMESPRPQAAPHMEAPRPQVHMEAPRQQAVPHMQSAPQAAPRPEMRRGGGGEPHGQVGPQPRGQNENHGRR